jgi:MFS family permease
VFQVVQVVLAERIFVIGEGGGTSLGLLYAAAGVGTGLGPILARRLTGDRDRPLRIALGVAYVLAALGLFIIAPLAGFAWVLFGAFLRSFGGGINWVFSTQLLLHAVPDRMRGRAFSTEFAMLTLANAASTALGGWALDHAGLSLGQIIVILGVLTLLPGVLWLAAMVFARPKP